jgi:4-alpha-glucanotransferase
MSDADLLALADEVGVTVDWIDFDSRERRVEVETIRAILEGLGHDTKSPADALAAFRARPAPNFLIVEADTAFVLPTKAQRARVTLEDGRQQDLLRDGDALTLSLAEPGYHTLEFDDRVVTLAVRPPRCLTPRDLLGRDAWGLTTQIYALRDHGASGDFTGLAAFAEAAGAAGADALAISPTNALFPAAPERCSPYSPSSRDHLNILFGDPERARARRPRSRVLI